MKLRLTGRLPAGMDKDLGFALTSILREIESAFNEIEGYVLDNATHSTAVTADALIKTGRCKYKGFIVNVATAAGSIDIRDSASAGGGVIVESIAAGKAVGRYELVRPIICETGLYVDYNAGPATGTLILLYE